MNFPFKRSVAGQDILAGWQTIKPKIYLNQKEKKTYLERKKIPQVPIFEKASFSYKKF